MYNTTYPSTPLPTCYLVPASSLFFVLVVFISFFSFLFISFAPAILRACVYYVWYGKVYVFVRYSNQSIDQSALLSFA